MLTTFKNLWIKLFEKIENCYLISICGWVIGWRCLLVIFRASLGIINHQDMNNIVRDGSKKVLTLTKTQYQIHYKHPLTLKANELYIFMSNHQSLIDIPLIYASMSGTIRFIAKKELFRIPVFGKMLAISGCVPVDRNKPAHQTDFFEQVSKSLKSNITLWIFPEGTRSKTMELLPFKNGCFRLAKELSAKIIPVGIINTGAVLPPGKFKFGLNKITKINIGEPIDTLDYQTTDQQKLLIENVRSAIANLIVI